MTVKHSSKKLKKQKRKREVSSEEQKLNGQPKSILISKEVEEKDHEPHLVSKTSLFTTKKEEKISKKIKHKTEKLVDSNESKSKRCAAEELTANDEEVDCKNPDSEPFDENAGEPKPSKQRKRERRSKKQKKTPKKEITAFDESHSALVYLSTWKNDKVNWSFKKSRQVWLVKNMYNKIAIPDHYFSILLEYLMGLKGLAKVKTLKDAEALYTKNSDSASEIKKFKAERAREVIQHLSG